MTEVYIIDRQQRSFYNAAGFRPQNARRGLIHVLGRLCAFGALLSVLALAGTVFVKGREAVRDRDEANRAAAASTTGFENVPGCINHGDRHVPGGCIEVIVDVQTRADIASATPVTTVYVADSNNKKVLSDGSAAATLRITSKFARKCNDGAPGWRVVWVYGDLKTLYPVKAAFHRVGDDLNWGEPASHPRYPLEGGLCLRVKTVDKLRLYAYTPPATTLPPAA